MTLADADADAYGRLRELDELADDDERRRRELPGAVREAIDVPHCCLGAALDMLRVLRRLLGTTSRYLHSDLVIAAILADAAARSAACNVRINLPRLEDANEAGRIEAETDAALLEAGSLCAEIERSDS